MEVIRLCSASRGTNEQLDNSTIRALASAPLLKTICGNRVSRLIAATEMEFRTEGEILIKFSGGS